MRDQRTRFDLTQDGLVINPNTGSMIICWVSLVL